MLPDEQDLQGSLKQRNWRLLLRRIRPSHCVPQVVQRSVLLSVGVRSDLVMDLALAYHRLRSRFAMDRLRMAGSYATLGFGTVLSALFDKNCLAS